MKMIDTKYDWACHDERIRKHYAHACEKHPYFCDWVLPEQPVKEYFSRRNLPIYRRILMDEIERGNVIPETLLLCEAAEIWAAIEQGDTAAAVEECYDAIAVLLRTVDVIEGRQKLGMPECQLPKPRSL